MKFRLWKCLTHHVGISGPVPFFRTRTFRVKKHAYVGYSLAIALIMPLFRYSLFARKTPAAQKHLTCSHRPHRGKFFCLPFLHSAKSWAFRRPGYDGRAPNRSGFTHRDKFCFAPFFFTEKHLHTPLRFPFPAKICFAGTLLSSFEIRRSMLGLPV